MKWTEQSHRACAARHRGICWMVALALVFLLLSGPAAWSQERLRYGQLDPAMGEVVPVSGGIGLIMEAIHLTHMTEMDRNLLFALVGGTIIGAIVGQVVLGEDYLLAGMFTGAMAGQWLYEQRAWPFHNVPPGEHGGGHGGGGGGKGEDAHGAPESAVVARGAGHGPTPAAAHPSAVPSAAHPVPTLVALPVPPPKPSRGLPDMAFRDCPECPEMVVVPAGSFLMGSPASEVDRDVDEGPLRLIKIERPFAMGKFEVTFSEWDACVDEGGCAGYRPDDRGWGRGRRPVIYVGWEDARRYVTWLARRTSLSYRLPSEAEWEYAARAGSTGPFHTGDAIGTEVANFDGSFSYASGPKGIFRSQTTEVGSFPANPFGLHDVHGNVSEWVEDCWSGTLREIPANGSAYVAGGCNRRVLRGGSWDYQARFIRSANRQGYQPDKRLINYGFRVARALSPS